MIQVEKLSYGFPAKDLFHQVSFALEAGSHYALIGSNGTGKSTLVDMLINTDSYFFDGKIIKDEDCRIGYASQFSVRDKQTEITVFEYLSEKFIENQKAITGICDEMAKGENMEALLSQYQKLLDLNTAMDGDSYETNINRALHVAGMEQLENMQLSLISGGEYKLLQIMKEMLLAPNLLILDEPDVFLDFSNLNSLCNLINSYKGTLLVVTHNRYLLNHCFNKILHLENGDIQSFDGSYTEYRCRLLKEKLELKLQHIEEQTEIERTQEMVEILRKRATLLVNPVIGRSVNAKQSQLDRLYQRQIKAPFIDIHEPEIMLPEVVVDPEQTVLEMKDYQVDFDKKLLEHVNFSLKAGEKVAIVGSNGTGKTTMIRDILKNENPSIKITENVPIAILSQLQGEILDEEKTIYEIMLDAGFTSKDEACAYLRKYCFDNLDLDQKVGSLSGGEQNLLQIGLIASSNAQLLILDEPTSHLDINAQMALEKAIAEYKGTLLMVSHDFYLIANCADYVLYVEDNTVRTMRTRKFRKMIYETCFNQKYLEIDKKKQELEAAIRVAFKKNDLVAVHKLCEQLEVLSENSKSLA